MRSKPLFLVYELNKNNSVRLFVYTLTYFMKAIWNGKVIAKSDDVEEIEGNYYFPIDSIKRQYFIESNTHSTCPWKGKASYFNIVVNGEINEDGAWYYPNPNEFALVLKDRIAFWKGVEVRESSTLIKFELLNVLNSFF
jgi:uncharacterized protein (DUF427 family)